MLLQNTLDLSTFEIVRFRIWNQTSQPSDRGFGSKYFNTNSGHEAYCREEIFTPIGWRTAAYMDDIEAITNGEGSLGTRVKALEDMLGLEDVTDVIDTWNDVKAFFANVDEGLNLMTMLNSKAEWAERIPDLSFKHIGCGYANQGFWTSGPALSFGANTNYFGQIQMDIMPVPTIKIRSYNKGYGEWQTLIHTGNYSDLITGTLGVNITGNAATATKLQDDTAYTAWGQTFFENGKPKSIQGGLSNVTYIRFLDAGTNGIYRGSSFASSQNATDISYVATGHYFYINGASAMTITEEGNVVINTSNSLSRKLAVGAGGTFLYARASSVALGEHADDTVLIGSGAYGMQLWADSSTAASNIQAMNYGGTATAYALNLNPLGGAVNIASSGALTNIYGPLCLSGKTLDDARIAFNREGVNYITFPSTGSLAFANDIGAESIILRLDTNRLYPNVTNAVSLGTSSYRWSNVYSTLGDFNGVVTIHSNADGTELLRFATDRAWKFSQLGTGAATALCLSPDATSKSFIIADSDTSRVFEFWVSESNSSANFNSKLTVEKTATFNGSALIPTGRKMLFGKNGSAIEYDADANAIKVTGNIYATGTVASGGKAEEGENTTGNAMVYQYDLASGESVYTVDNVKGSTNVIVQIFEWNSNTSSWDMILTDVSVKADAITVTFGRTTTVNHMVTVC